MKKFYILAERTNLDGYKEQFSVSVDNTATDDYDSILFFDSKEEALGWTKSDKAKEWKDCSFEVVEDEGR
jgi:heme-degrading monooxygenase HmoA